MSDVPQHWQELTGPSNWFQVSFPPQWNSEEREGAVALRPSDSQAFVAINTIWLAENSSRSAPGLKEIIAQFPRSRNVQPLSGGPLDHLIDCQRGQACLEPRLSWWKELFHPAHWRCWTMWAFRSENLYVIVTLLHDGERDNELESLTRMVLGTLQIPNQPADPPEVFAERALQLARQKFPLLECELGGEFQLRMGSSRLNLQNFYRSYLRSPEQFEKIVLPALTTVVQIQEWGEAQTEPPLDAVRNRIMPMLYPHDAWQKQFPEFIGSPWIGGLAVLYVVDETNAYWYVRESLLEKWKLTQDELHDIAIENLQEYFLKQPMEMAVAATEDETPSMLMPATADSYNSSRLLSHAFQGKLREFVGGDLVIGVPGRDFFVAVSMKADVMINHIRERVREDYVHTDHPLTDRLLLISADGVSELHDD